MKMFLGFGVSAGEAATRSDGEKPYSDSETSSSDEEDVSNPPRPDKAVVTANDSSDSSYSSDSE